MKTRKFIGFYWGWKLLRGLTVGLCVVRVFEVLNFHFTTKFYYLHNLSIYDIPRITYEPLLGVCAFFSAVFLCVGKTYSFAILAFERWLVRIANVYGFCVGYFLFSIFFIILSKSLSLIVFCRFSLNL